MDEAAKVLSQAQSVQQVLALIIVVLGGVVLVLAKLLWDEIKTNREKIEALYRDTLLRLARALEEDKHGSS